MLGFFLQTPPEPALSPLFSDHAVLQRDRPIPIFGKAVPGSRVRVRLGGDERAVTADGNGNFKAWFPARKATRGLTISVDGTVRAQDVAVGEVWIASGQSNMEWSQAASDDFERAKQEADPDVRMLTVPRFASLVPQTTFNGAWLPARAETVGTFSGVANAFARELHRALRVPVGIIHSSWGGTVAQAWTPRAALPPTSPYAPFAAQVQVPLGVSEADREAAREARRKFDADREVILPEMPIPPSTENWQTATIPLNLSQVWGPAKDGVLWVQKTFTITPENANKPLTFRLGQIDDYDDTYVDGRLIGQTGRGTPNSAAVERVYRHPGLSAGDHTLTIRVVDILYNGGWADKTPELRVEVEGGTTIPLGGEARVLPGTVLSGDIPRDPVQASGPNLPGVLYDGMIAPLAGYPVRGAIWYQGESNARESEHYRDLMATLIDSWRTTFHDRKMPFYVVSLANHMARTRDANESFWGALREAQRQVSLTVPFTGQALAIDIGEAGDIHPRNKREVGRRLALQALAKTYGKRVEADGPAIKSVRWQGDRVTLTFTNARGMRTVDGQPPREFAVRSGDAWVWGEAQLRGDTVTVRHPQGLPIDAVRYAWANNPDVNLVGASGLPAQPFVVTWPTGR